MATKKSEAPASKKKGTAVVNWDQELANAAKESMEMEKNTAGGSFFSIKSGQLSWQDNPIKNNELPVIILDSILENVFYEGDYDPDDPQPPMCFAFGRDESTLAPHANVVEAGNQQCGASGLCDGCEMNEFGSADKGKGKACKNTRRLALLPAGKFTKDGELDLPEDEDHYANSEIGFMKLPVTSVKGYSAFVKQLANTLNRPPFGVIAHMEIVPDAKSQFKVVFSALMNVPDEFMPAIMKRREEAKAAIDFPYQAPEVKEKSARGKPKPKTAKRGKY